MTLHRGPADDIPTPNTDQLTEHESRIAHFMNKLKDLDGIPYAFGERLRQTALLEEAINARNSFLWSIPAIRQVIEFQTGLDTLKPAHHEPRYVR